MRTRIPMGLKKTVIYHHRENEKMDGCPECYVPAQGETFEIEIPDE